MKLNSELVMIELDSASKEEVLKTLGNQLHENGYVTEDFVESILQREKNFPTGLPTTPFGVAIPHTDADKVIEPQMAFASLKNPVPFQAMGSGGDKVEVSLVFMLALNKPEDQLQTLQKLTGLFQDEEMVVKLRQIKSTEEFNELMNSVENAS